MNSTEFVNLKLNELKRHFPTARFRHEYDGLMKFHTIYVRPGRLYYNPEFSKFERELTNSFIKQYRNEGILFVSD